MRRRTAAAWVGAALVAVLAIGALAGCTAEPAATSTAGTTAAPASVQGFACPTAAEVAGLTAIPFTASTSSTRRCGYTTAADASTVASVTVRHPAGRGNLSALRSAAVGRGVRTADARGIAFDAFTTTTKRSCTFWFLAADGAPTSAAARRSGATGTEACDLATAVATLTGSATSTPLQPTVAVIAPRTLLGGTTAGQRWPWRIGQQAAVRIDRLTGTGYLNPSSTSSYAAVAAGIPADSAAVVFVSGTAEAGTSSLTVLRAATRALSAASSRAPKAELVVVGPVTDGTVPAVEAANLAEDLQAAAKVAGARYVDPATLAGAGTGGAVELAGLADGVVTALRASGVPAS